MLVVVPAAGDVCGRVSRREEQGGRWSGHGERIHGIDGEHLVAQHSVTTASPKSHHSVTTASPQSHQTVAARAHPHVHSNLSKMQSDS